MMNYVYKNPIYMLITIIFTAMPVLLTASISYEVKYDKSYIFFDKIENRDIIRIKGIGVTGKTGNPILPSECVNFLLPEGMEAESIAVEVDQPYTLPGKYNIMPCPQSVDLSEDTENTYTYNSPMPYPGKRVSILKSGFYKSNNIAQIAIYPIDYFPREGKVVFYENIKITLQTKFTGRKGLSQHSSIPLSEYIEKKALKSIVVNDFDIPLSTNYNKLRDTNKPEYLIITNDSLRSGFIPFANYLKKKGVIAEIAVIENIINSGYYDEVSSLYDDAAAVRGFLTEKYTQGVQWVLLGGDEDIVPVRYGNYIRNDTFVDYRAPSDLYYSDLNGNWNVDGDELYGEPIDDNIDIFPELFVGRVPCKNLEELNHWFEKLVSYETVPGEEKGTYLTKFLWTGSDNLRAGPKHTIQNSQIPNHISHDTTMLEQSDGILPRGSDVINKMGENFGFYNLFGHGSPDLITVSCPGDNHRDLNRDFLVSVDSVETGTGGCNQEYGNGLDSLKNKDSYSIMSVSSCFQAAFDFDKFPYRYKMRGPTLGEAFLLLPESGGPAFLGYTRYGGGYIELAQVQIDLFDKMFVDSITNIGAAEALSKTEYLFYDTQINHTLLGCPLMQIWTAIPKEMEVLNYANTIPPEPKTISINVREKGPQIPLENAYVCLWKGAELYQTGFTDNNGQIDLQITPQTEGSILLTITKENFIPYSDTIRVSDDESGSNDKIISAVSFCKIKSSVYYNEVPFDIYMPEKGNALLDIYDPGGRKITTIVDGKLNKGIHSIKWKGFNTYGNAIPEGIYFFRFQYKDQISRGKFLFIK